MKTAARRASRRLTTLPATFQVLHRHIDRLHLDLERAREQVGHTLLDRGGDLRKHAAVLDCELQIGARSASFELDTEPAAPLS
jgi:hypothetical protein